MRDQRVYVRVGDDERGLFEALATHFGTDMSTAIRMVVREKVRELGLPDKPAKTRARKK